VRPYLQHAAAVVAPLRVARGIQNKILEAMAMAQPVITVPSCADAIGANASQGLLRAASPDTFVQALHSLLEGREAAAEMGQRARQYVVDGYSWQAHMGGIDRWLGASPVEGGR
jgi:polysaccharide biosynthesis protein PslH